MKGPMLLFFFERINTEENLFLFVTTPATNIPRILPVYFGDVHHVRQRCKTCRLAEFRGVDPSCLKIWDPLGKRHWESAAKR